MDRDMKIYIKNDANVTEEFIQTLETQDELQEQLDKIRKQTRRWRGLSVIGCFALVVILLYSVVTVIKSDNKQKTYFVDIKRSMPEIKFDSLEEYPMSIDYLYHVEGSEAGITKYSIAIEADDYRIANFNVNSTNIIDASVTLKKWLDKKGVDLSKPTESYTETLSLEDKMYESSALASLLINNSADYSVKSIAKSEKKFKCSPKIHFTANGEVIGDYANLINTYFNKDFVDMFASVNEYKRVEEDNDYFYISFYNKDVDIDEVCDIVTQFLSDNVGYFAQIEPNIDNDAINVLLAKHAALEGNICYRLQPMFGTGTRYEHIDYDLKVLLQDLDSEVKTEYDQDAPIVVKFCVSGEYYDFYAYIMHMYGLI